MTDRVCVKKVLLYAATFFFVALLGFAISLPYGNCQWTRFHFVVQAYYWPGSQGLAEHNWPLSVAPEMTGTWRTWHRNLAKRSEAHLLDGVEHGKAITWYASGIKAEDANYFRGLRHGTWRKWHPNGTRAFVGKYFKDIRIGKHRAWYQDGSPKYEWSYAERPDQGAEVRHGVWKTWWPNGQLEKLEHYENNTPVGTWTQWYKNGQKSSETKLVEGEWVSTCWNENGEAELRVEEAPPITDLPW